MEKNMELSLLLDFYGELLTEKVRTATEMYYNDDLSLSEIALDMGITRQGVRDLIKRAEQNLYSFEEKLGLYKRFIKTQEGLEKLKEMLINAKSHKDSNVQKNEFYEEISHMTALVDKMIEEV